MDASSPEALRGLTARDVMLAAPKTLPCHVTVAEAREMLADDHVQMLLLTDGPVFRGAVTSLPDGADPASPALDHADPSAETIAPTESAEAAYERTSRSPYRRVIVVGPDGTLAGLLCLNPTLTRFCSGRPSS